MSLTQQEKQALIDLANTARQRAYVPYSNYPVGAALRTKTGRLYTGVNVENAAYPQTMCAERVAIFKALSEGHRSFKSIVIVADTEDPTPPCGACRQIIWEFCGDIEVTLANLQTVTKTLQMKDLLPLPFDKRLL